MLHIIYYFMASSASGQDEPNRALWLATRAGKMEPSCPLGTTRCIPHEKFPRKLYKKSFIDQVCSVKMVGYWPRSFFASLWTSTSSQFINTQKKNLANIQPSWPHTWSVTHTYLPTNCNTIQIWSWCSRYLSSVGNRYPAIYVASYVEEKVKWKKCRQKDFKMLRAVLLSICWIIKQLYCSISRNIVWF